MSTIKESTSSDESPTTSNKRPASGIRAPGPSKRHCPMTTNTVRQAQITCDLCNVPFPTRNAQRMHMQRKHHLQRSFGCHLCAKVFPRKDNRDRHVKDTHLKTAKVRCRGCGIQCRSDVLQKHLSAKKNAACSGAYRNDEPRTDVNFKNGLVNFAIEKWDDPARTRSLRSSGCLLEEKLVDDLLSIQSYRECASRNSELLWEAQTEMDLDVLARNPFLPAKDSQAGSRTHNSALMGWTSPTEDLVMHIGTWCDSVGDQTERALRPLVGSASISHLCSLGNGTTSTSARHPTFFNRGRRHVDTGRRSGKQTTASEEDPNETGFTDPVLLWLISDNASVPQELKLPVESKLASDNWVPHEVVEGTMQLVEWQHLVNTSLERYKANLDTFESSAGAAKSLDCALCLKSFDTTQISVFNHMLHHIHFPPGAQHECSCCKLRFCFARDLYLHTNEILHENLAVHWPDDEISPLDASWAGPLDTENYDRFKRALRLWETAQIYQYITDVLNIIKGKGTRRSEQSNAKTSPSCATKPSALSLYQGAYSDMLPDARNKEDDRLVDLSEGCERLVLNEPATKLDFQGHVLGLGAHLTRTGRLVRAY